MTNPLSFIDENFDYINLFMFIGLYITCFVYLLQDTVKTIKMGFANMIGIFVAQFFFLLIAVFTFPTGLNFYLGMCWRGIIITILLELISSFILLLKYKSLQDRYEDDVILEGKISGNKYRLTGPYSPNDFYTNALICIDVVTAFIMFMILKFKDYASPWMMSLFPNASIFIVLIMVALSSIMVHYSTVVYNIIPPDNKIPTSINNKTIPALMFIFIFHLFFVFFISFLISKNDVLNSNMILKMSWGSIFVSVLFQIISIFMVIVPYKFLNDNYFSKNIELPFSGLLNQELKDYNNLFVAVTTITIIFVALLIHDSADLRGKGLFFEPTYYCAFIYGMSISILSMSSEMIKISNDFLSFKNNAPKNFANNDLSNVVPKNVDATTPKS